MPPSHVPSEPLEIALGVLNGELHKRLLEPGLVTVEQWNEHIAPRFKAVADVILGSRVHARSYRVHESLYPPASTPAEVARLAVDEMGGDNGCTFKPSREQLARLVGGIARMRVAGCAFTTEAIELWAAGEHGEMLAAFQHFDGFDEAQQAMVDIFDGLPPLSHDEAPTEIRDLFARNTGDYMPTETEKAAIDHGLAEIMRQLGRPGAPRVLFRPLLTSGLIGNGSAGTTYVVIDSEQPEAAQAIALWHETLHLLGLKDETLVEAMAQRLAQACPEVLAAVKRVADVA